MITQRKENNKISLGIIIDTDLSIPPKTGVTYRLYYLSKRLVEKGFSVKLFICNRGIKSENDLIKLFSQSGIEIHIIPQNVFYNFAQMEDIVRHTGINILQFEDPVSVVRFYKIGTNLKIPVCLANSLLRRFLTTDIPIIPEAPVTNIFLIVSLLN